MVDIAQLQARLAAYLAAELKILQSQEYQMGQGGNQRRNRRADLEQVRAAITEIKAEIAAAEAVAGTATGAAGGRRIYNIVPTCL